MQEKQGSWWKLHRRVATSLFTALLPPPFLRKTLALIAFISDLTSEDQKIMLSSHKHSSWGQLVFGVLITPRHFREYQLLLSSVSCTDRQILHHKHQLGSPKWGLGSIKGMLLHNPLNFTEWYKDEGQLEIFISNATPAMAVDPRVQGGHQPAWYPRWPVAAATALVL